MLLVVNPRVRAAAAEVIALAWRRLHDAGWEPELFVAPDIQGAARALTARLREPRVAAVVAVGGDGTAHHVVNALVNAHDDVGARAPLGLLPVGTGNDFARVFGLTSTRSDDAIAALVSALPDGGRWVDLGRVASAAGTRHFVGVFSAGFDAVVNCRADRLRWVPAGQRYNLAVLVELARFRPRRYQLELEGQAARPQRYLLAACANGQYIGSGMRLAPGAQVEDGVFDVVTVDALAAHRPGMVARFLTLFPRVFAGTHLGTRGVEVRRARTVRIALADGAPFVAYADGEPVADLPATVTVVPDAVRVLV